MKNVFFCLLFLGLFSFSGLCQTSGYQVATQAFTVEIRKDINILRPLELDSTFARFSTFGQDFLYYLNFVRAYPKEFKTLVIDPYLKLHPELLPVYGSSLQKILLSLEPLSQLKPDKRLLETSFDHVFDLTKTSSFSHNSSNGTSFGERLRAKSVFCGSECISKIPFASPLEALVSLLIDFNIPSLGHRKALLGASMVSCGVSSLPTKNNAAQLTVVDLGCN